MTDQTRPLEGLTVLDLTRALAGPYATLLLAGLGAKVIKIEEPVGGDLARENSPYLGRDGIMVERAHEDDISLSHLTRARGKYGVSLNLKRPEGKKLFMELVAKADIVVENFTAGTADRLGVGYEACAQVNPRIVFASLSGFGANDRSGKAMDVIIQALSGAMFTSGEPGHPPVRIGIPIADMLAPVFTVIGILAAIEQRHRTGVGQHVDVSMLGALTSFVAIENWSAMAAAGMPARTGLTVQRLSPFGVFECADGYVAVVAVHEPLARGLFDAMGQRELGDDPRFANRDARVANAEVLEATINAWSRQLPVAQVCRLLEERGVPVAPVRHPEDALVDPRVVERHETMAIEHPTYGSNVDLRTAGIPIQFSAASTGFDDALPVYIGQHNEDVYAQYLGLSPDDVARLKSEGVI
ncbi:MULTISPECIES: CaiB/BaiF CoA transferase family protein [unclassified Novosphingobium]|uniref:CaiB/BaiF CoA transferase family protein n=1 Tax=unclassified Novosphingobium TaxID=2644732 RepID=UPI00086BA07B|nr:MULTISPECIES: CaiB/BaiF CoA-transferase family protein [unclassified Novosphingobium]MBN9146374.1 CoA transferase [Novosphingobium sp.]MDR6709116.1 crotonobetainyl-CoA:carnitine CoA-transferase CaiB-like acyl-CoA transferase [Novosphingobium sp. 1748]ODU79624.1 MAG: carnitine dehydratase [Novosphingobium sp. SCN 63-17]OJX95216.1 MAG: carnitine dehydratase [Novosphingobium sp. 63-713]